MEKTSFEQRVVDVAIAQTKCYQATYVEWEYLVCSKGIRQRNYYIIAARPDNFQHLIGVHALVPPQIFFDKCLNGTLSTADFDFSKPNIDEKSVKGSVRRKIKSLPHMMTMLTDTLLVQESFVKNRVSCTFATSDNIMTVGFIGARKARPMTLLASNELEMTQANTVDIILGRRVGEPLFHEVIVGTSSAVADYIENIADIIAPEVISVKCLT